MSIIGLFFCIILLFFICIIVAMVGYCVFSLLKKDKIANVFYVFGMVFYRAIQYGIGKGQTIKFVLQ